MPRIEVDDNVYDFLKKIEVIFKETPNTILRRLLEIDNCSSQGPHNDSDGTVPPVRKDDAESAKTRALQKARERKKLARLRTEGRVDRKKQPKANLPELVEAGLLKNGQVLFLHDYQQRRIGSPRFQAKVCGDKLLWIDKIQYSMSRLAQRLFQEKGYESSAVRGPWFWHIENGESITELWDKYVASNWQQSPTD